MNSISTTELAAVGNFGAILDVREADEFAQARVDGAMNLPMSELPDRLSEISRDQTVYVMCLSGGRSAQAVSYLSEQGYDVVNVLGGISAWHQNGLPIAMGA
ncbi:MAG: rhodanese-like domain-containing protein [Homoserinimonas sp.]